MHNYTKTQDGICFVEAPFEVGSGKSSGCIWHILLNAWKQPVDHDGVRRSRYGIIRASYPALKSTTIKTWQHWFGPLVNVVFDVPIRGTLKMPHPDGETQCYIELVFIALDREDNINKIQSLELTGCHMNEAAEIQRGIHQMLKTRVNRYPDMKIGGAAEPFIICDYNSVPTDHWLYKIAEEEQPPKHGFYHQPAAVLMVRPGESDIVDAAGNCYVLNPDADNLFRHIAAPRNQPPTKVSTWDKDRKQWRVPNLAEDYYEDMIYGGEPDFINVMIMNNYGELRTGKPVYPEYIDSIHFDEKLLGPIKGIPIIIGMDLGLTPAATFSQLTPTGLFQTFDEIVTDDCSIRKFCEDFLKPHIQNNYRDHNFELIIDPAANIRSQNDAKAAAEIIKESGLAFRVARTNNPMKRREAIVYFLRKLNGFLIGPKCGYLRKGFISEYKFEKKRLAIANVRGDNTEMFKEKPDKNIYSHVHDAEQYAALEASEGKSAKKSLACRPSRVNRPADSEAGY